MGNEPEVEITEKIPLLKRWRKKKVEEDGLTAPSASIRQLYRYASYLDVLMVLVGCGVSIVAGMGLPFVAIVIGDISQTFIDYKGKQLQYESNSSYDMSMAKNEFEREVIQGCLKYVYISVAILFSSIIQVTCFLISCENICNRMRRAYFKAIMRQEISWFDKNQSGTLATKLFDSMERVREGTGDKLGLMVQLVSQFFGGFIIAFSYDWRLTLIMMSMTPFMIICGVFITKLMASATAEESKKYAIAGKIAEEVLTSMKTVISFNGQDGECKKYDAALEAGKAGGIKKSLYAGIGLALTMAINLSSYGFAFWVGTDYIYWGWVDSATVRYCYRS